VLPHSLSGIEIPGLYRPRDRRRQGPVLTDPKAFDLVPDVDTLIFESGPCPFEENERRRCGARDVQKLLSAGSRLGRPVRAAALLGLELSLPFSPPRLRWPRFSGRYGDRLAFNRK